MCTENLPAYDTEHKKYPMISNICFFCKSVIDNLLADFSEGKKYIECNDNNVLPEGAHPNTQNLK